MNPPWELIDAHFDGELTAEQAERLTSWLSSNPEHVRLFVREAHLRGSLRTELARMAVPVGEAEVVPFPASTGDHPARLRGSRLMALAASVALLIGLAHRFFGAAMGEPILAEVMGGVRLERLGQSLAAAPGTRLLPGDMLHITTNARAAIAFGAERTRFNLPSGTELRLVALSTGKRFDLRAGTLIAEVARQRPFKPLVVTTPNARARVIGTQFKLTATTNRTRLDVVKGTVRLVDTAGANFGASAQVGAGHYAVVAAATELAALPATGGLLREQWLGLSKEVMGMLPFSLSFPGKPNSSDRLALFEFVDVRTNHCATRLRGYLHPAVTGEHTFWMASAKPAYLFLSRSDSPQAAQGELSSGEQAFREWDFIKGAGQGGRHRSLPIPLTAGRRYYVEVITTAPAGEAHLSVAWQPPGGPRETIRGEFLSPFQPAK